jgi:hypothetical protein
MEIESRTREDIHEIHMAFVNVRTLLPGRVRRHDQAESQQQWDGGCNFANGGYGCGLFL